MKPQIYAHTPIFQSPALNAAFGKQIYFKMDCHQPTRSFKLRGMSHLVQAHVANGQMNFVASSGGNAGYSLAYACRQVGARVLVVVPQTTNARMRALIAGEGAELIVFGESWQEAHAHALSCAASRNAVYVSPFDDPLLWTGHATMITECAEEISAPDVVVAAVGGGGLLCGIMEGMEQVGWRDTVFLAAETLGAASYARALEAGELVTLDAIDTIATSLGAKRVAAEALEWSKKRRVLSHLCTDLQAIEGMRSLGDAFQVIVEPACGAAMAALHSELPEIKNAASIMVIVCGGAAIDTQGLSAYLSQLPS